MCNYIQNKCAAGCGSIVSSTCNRCYERTPSTKNPSKLAHPGTRSNTTELRGNDVCTKCKGKGKKPTYAESAFSQDSMSSFSGWDGGSTRGGFDGGVFGVGMPALVDGREKPGSSKNPKGKKTPGKKGDDGKGGAGRKDGRKEPKMHLFPVKTDRPFLR